MRAWLVLGEVIFWRCLELALAIAVPYAVWRLTVRPSLWILRRLVWS